MRSEQDTGTTFFSRSWNKFYVKSFKEPYIYDVLRGRGGGGRGGLEPRPVFVYHVIFKQ